MDECRSLAEDSDSGEGLGCSFWILGLHNHQAHTGIGKDILRMMGETAEVKPELRKCGGGRVQNHSDLGST